MTRRKKQPTAEVMREQLALAADEIIRLRDQMARKHNRFWKWLTALNVGAAAVIAVGQWLT